MHLEIERRFLVDPPPDDLGAHPHAPIAQGYLVVAADGSAARVRRYGEAYHLTVKHGTGTARREADVELTAVQFAALWPATEGRRLEKTRYRLPLGGHVVELDVFAGRHAGLVIAEVEFRTREAAAGFAPPAWFGREVTDDPTYRNSALAERAS